LAYPSTLKMVAICSLETSSSLQKTLSYKSEDLALQSIRRENLRSMRILRWQCASLYSSNCCPLFTNTTCRIEYYFDQYRYGWHRLVLRESRHRVGTHASDMPANTRSEWGTVRVLKTCP
jgi:hypothetical protein